MNESTSYLKIEVLGETVENGERVIHRRKTCIGNPVEHFVTDEVVRVPIVEKEKVKVKATVTSKIPVRARNKRGWFAKDDPTTPENEAWVGGVAPKPKRKRGRPRKKVE